MKNEFKKFVMTLRKARDPMASIMVFHLSEIEKIGKNDGNRETTEDEAIQYTKKAVQKLKEYDFADAEEISMLEQFLPKMASKDEVRDFVFAKEAEEGLDISNKGAVMKAVKGEFGALVDMKMVAGMF